MFFFFFVLFFFVFVFFFWGGGLVFCRMIGKTFVMFGYANKEFEFEFEI